jgi:glycosyltransferase involved in cell wall biosynthesis
VSIAYSIDSLRIRDGRCFGWGFLIDPESAAVDWALHMPVDGGGMAVMHGVPGGTRLDLAQAFPGVAHAPAAGFILQGTLPRPLAPGRDATLEVVLRDGRRIERIVPAAVMDAACGGPLPPWTTRLRMHVARHGLRGTVAEAASRLRTRLAFFHALRQRRFALVIDHDMGGGANVFRRGLVERLAAAGPCFVLTPVVDLVAYRVSLHWRGRHHDRVEWGLQAALARFDTARGIDLHVNEVVSFPDPLAVLDWCGAARASRRARLTFYLHDFHAVCPAWTLMGVDDRFCGIPETAACATCLPANRVHTLGFAPAGLGIDEWRASWERFLGACDRIRAFSRASVDILTRVYPAIAGKAAIEVEGHVVPAGLRPARLPARTATDPVVVACAGHISIAKGARMLRDMADYARKRHLPMRFVVFGSLDGHEGTPGIEVVGAYDREALPSLLEQHGVSVAMLPSVCAETFSFVTAEFMEMQVPVAVFPIGAPAERVAGYPKGLVISRIDPVAAVHEILAFAGHPDGMPVAQAI